MKLTLYVVTLSKRERKKRKQNDEQITYNNTFKRVFIEVMIKS